MKVRDAFPLQSYDRIAAWALVFWCVLAVSVIWCGLISANTLVRSFYHPVAALGDLLHPLRLWAIAGPSLVGIAMLCIRVGRHPLAPRVYCIGLFVLVAAAIAPSLPPIDSGYRQAYWLGEDKYEIPWQYGPYNGSLDRGGKYFLVSVSVPDLLPQYETRSETIIIGKAVDYNHGKGGAAPEKTCLARRYRFECQWRRGNSVYLASGEADLLPSEASGLMVSAADLLDSFEVPEP